MDTIENNTDKDRQEQDEIGEAEERADDENNIGEDRQEQEEIDDAEEQHHLDCNIALLQYSVYLQKEIDRREKHLKQLPNIHRQYLPFKKMLNDVSKLKLAVNTNQILLNDIVSGSIYEKHTDYLHAKFITYTAKPHHMSKVKTTIEQIVRDWSKEGEAERNECYLPIISELKKHLPINNSNTSKEYQVLVPGFGLARILLDVRIKVCKSRK
jgi:carnosine N-methyltransferase